VRKQEEARKQQEARKEEEAQKVRNQTDQMASLREEQQRMMNEKATEKAAAAAAEEEAAAAAAAEEAAAAEVAAAEVAAAGAGAKNSVVTKRKNYRKSVEGSSIVFEGYLEKKSRMKSWQKRWFVVAGHYLKYYQSDTKAKLLAAIDLSQVEADTEDATLRLKLAPGKTMQLRAATAEDAFEWATAMRSAKKAKKVALSKAEEADLADPEGAVEPTKDDPAKYAAKEAAAAGISAAVSVGQSYGEEWMQLTIDFATMEAEEKKMRGGAEAKRKEREEERALYLSISRKEVENKSVRDAEEEKRRDEEEEAKRIKRAQREKEEAEAEAREQAEEKVRQDELEVKRVQENEARLRMETRAQELMDAKTEEARAAAAAQKALQEAEEKDRIALEEARRRLEQRTRQEAEDKLKREAEEEVKRAQQEREEERNIYLSLAKQEISKQRLLTQDAGLSCKISIESGSLGIHADESVDRDYKLQFIKFTGKSDAEAQSRGDLKDGMCLTHINKSDLKGMSWPMVLEMLKVRPVKLEFRTLVYISCARKLKDGTITEKEYSDLMRVDRADSKMLKEDALAGADIYNTGGQRLPTGAYEAGDSSAESNSIYNTGVKTGAGGSANCSSASLEQTPSGKLQTASTIPVTVDLDDELASDKFDAVLSEAGSLGMTFDFQSLNTLQINELLSVKGQAAAAGLRKGDYVIAVGGKTVDEDVGDAAFKKLLIDKTRPLTVRVVRPGPNGLVKKKGVVVEEEIDPNATVCRVCFCFCFYPLISRHAAAA
jgi:hypothetical protein